MTKRKFYKTTYVVEILSEEPIPDSMDLESTLVEANDGAYCANWPLPTTEEIDGKQAAETLDAYGSEPGFFGLDEEGNCEYDRTCTLCGDPVPQDVLREHLEQHQPNARTLGIDAVESLFEPND